MGEGDVQMPHNFNIKQLNGAAVFRTPLALVALLLQTKPLSLCLSPKTHILTDFTVFMSYPVFFIFIHMSISQELSPFTHKGDKT